MTLKRNGDIQPSMPHSKVLIAEDYEPFRQFVCSALSQNAGFEISEASDGLDAVQKAEGLRPDLILLDIGLPKLNGLEAAQQIRRLTPSTKILFISQLRSPDVIREAFRLGAFGFVHKANAQRDLLPAVETVLLGKRFVSGGLGVSEENISITELRQSDEIRLRYAAIVDSSDDAIIAKNVQGLITAWNPAARNMFGFTQEEAIGQPITMIIPPELQEEETEIVRRVRAGERIEHYQSRRVSKNGRNLDISLTISPIKNAEGEIIGISSTARDITERNRILTTLRESEERFRLSAQAGKMYAFDWDVLNDVIERSGDPVHIIGPDGLNQASSQQVWAQVHPGDREKLRAATAKLSPEEPQFRISHRMIRQDGEVIWVERNCRATFDKEGKMLRIVGMVADVTERKQTEDALRESEELLRMATRSGRMFAYDWDAATDKIVRSEGVSLILGEAEGAYTTGQRISEMIPPEDRGRLSEAVAQLTPEKPFLHIKYRMVRSDGALIWIDRNSRAYFDHDGKLMRIVGMIADITERVQAEEALFRHAAIVESSVDAISSVTLDGIIVTWNAGAQRMFGYTEKEAVGKPANIHVPPELRDQQKKILEALRAGGRIEQFETVRLSKTGKRIDVSLSISPVKDSTGTIVGCAGIAHDITTRKRAEEALLSSEQRYRLLFERNVAGVAIATLDGRLLDCNHGWAHILGYESKDELLGRHASEFYFNPAERKPLVDELFEKQVLFSRDLQLRRKDGTPVWVLFNAAVHSDHDRPIVQATMIDISERKSAEEALSGMTRKLIEAQEQERARIARDLHDDISQKVAILSVELEQLQDNPSEVKSRLQELQRRATEISIDVQALSHDLHSSKLEYLGVVTGMKSWCKDFAERQKLEIDFKSDVSRPLPQALGISLFRVLQEALQNVVKHSGVRWVGVQLREDSGEIHLVASDLGKGFDVQAASQGKGLGLTSMRERVRLLNGRISIESKPMGGTTIRVRVPLESGPADHAG